MKKNLRAWAGTAAATVIALGFSACAYDPYYSSTSVGGTYRSGYSGGYGDGYGYGGSSFSTSLFIGTGDDRWGYDPYSYSYYDYHRHAYYDPYLNGYYPVGYRPSVVYGVPHPYGWHPGGGYIRPPGRVYENTIGNYHDREGAYRNSRYDWAKQVRQRPVEQGRTVDSHYSGSSSDRRGAQYSPGTRSEYSRDDHRGSQSSDARYDSRSRSSESYIRQSQPSYRTEESIPKSYRQSSREPGRDRLPSSYNTAVSQKSQGHYRPSQSDARYSAPQKSEKSSRSSGRSRNEEDRGKVQGYR